MPEIQIRPAVVADIAQLIAIDHSYTSDNVWQMDIAAENGQMAIQFRETRLPRSVRVEYPRHPQSLSADWRKRAGLLVAVHEQEVVGYISIEKDIAPAMAWVTDLAVLRRLRRQGIGSALVLAGQEWSLHHKLYRMVLEMQPKNYPAISLSQKLGFDFCGYNDRYYVNNDIGLFFAKTLR